MRIRLLREAGGIGDVICSLGCATAIKRAAPDAFVTFYSLIPYGPLVRLCPDVDKFVGVPFNGRRDRDVLPDPAKHRYLRDGHHDATVDLFCPGWRHEWGTQGDVTKGRAQLFCERAAEVTGLNLTPTPPRLRVSEYDRGRADGWLQGKGLNPDRVTVALQPQANLDARMWPTNKWHALCEMLRRKMPRVQFACFGTHGKTRKLAHELKAAPAIYLDYPLAIAVLQRCSILVGVDSGFYHAAAAVGLPAVGIFGVTGGASTSSVYPKAVWVEAGDHERAIAKTQCTRHCYNMPSAGKETRCDAGPCPAMAEITIETVVALALNRLAI